MIWRQFYALGTQIEFCVDLSTDQEYLLDKAENEIKSFESKFSRFQPNSELSILNRQTGSWQEASSMMIDVLTQCRYFYLLTNKIFDPTIISTLENIGYGHSFHQLNLNKDNYPINNSPQFNKINLIDKNCFSFSDIKINNNYVYLPPNTRIDLGGIGKGYIIDYLSNNIFSQIQNYWLSAGGDLIVKGHEPDKIGWRIGIQDPTHTESNILYLQTKGEKLAVATSGILQKKGFKNNHNWHHIIDPRCNQQTNNGIQAVTVNAKSAMAADVFAKTALILGESLGLEFINNQPEIDGIMFPINSSPRYSENIFNCLDPK